MGVDDWLDTMVEALKKTDAQDVYHLENIPNKEVQVSEEYIKNISKTEKTFLVEKEYITENDALYLNVREIYNEEFSKFVRQLPRGNDEAEGRFRKQMEEK
jgi:hypothetical protein